MHDNLCMKYVDHVRCAGVSHDHFCIFENSRLRRPRAETKKNIGNCKLANAVEDLKYYTLSKDFLKSLDPLKKVVYPELPPLDIPGAEEIKEGQLELF